MRHKMEEHESHGPIVPHWMVTFSDMRTVLLCFFVLLVGFSGPEKENRHRAPGSLSGYPGMSETSHTDNDSFLPPSSSSGSTQMAGYESPSAYESLTNVYQGIDVRVRSTVLGNSLQYKMTEKGFEIRVLCGTLFEEQSTEIKDGADNILKVVADACKSLPHQLRVEAFADDLFLASEEFPTEESLALKRAAVVCARLNSQSGIHTERLSIGSNVPVSDAALAPPPKSQVTITVLPVSRKKLL